MGNINAVRDWGHAKDFVEVSEANTFKRQNYMLENWFRALPSIIWCCKYCQNFDEKSVSGASYSVDDYPYNS